MERARELGTDRIQVEAEAGARSLLEVEDLQSIRSVLAENYPQAVVSGQSVSGTSAIEGMGKAYLVASDVGEIAARSLRLLEGRWFKEAADPPEVVLEQPLVAALGESDSPIGQLLWADPARSKYRRIGLGGEIPSTARSWLVVGVIQSPGESKVTPLGFGTDRRFSGMIESVLQMLGVAPVEASWMTRGMSLHVDRATLKAAPVDWMVVSVDPARVNSARMLIEETLIRRGKVPLLYANAAWSILASPELDGYLVLHDVFFVVTVGVGLLVLINLLLLTGRRRRGEVGLRRAEGATRADIFWQFLWEVVLISLVGSILGVGVGVLVAHLRAGLDPSAVMTATLPWKTAIEAVLIATTGAAIACAAPAWAVSDVDPALLLREGR